MNDMLLVGYIICVLIFMAPATMHYHTYKKLTHKLTGKCVRIELRLNPLLKGGYYFIHFEYKYKNKTYRTSSIDSYSHKPPFKENELYTIFLNPDKPKRFSCKSPKIPLWQKLLLIVSCMLFIMMICDLAGLI